VGQKTHPIGFRLGGVKDWQAHWFAAKASDYRALTLEDQAIRRAIQERYGDSGAIARVEIERGPQDLVVTINTARPGIVIGRGGQRVDELRGDLERLTGKRARLNIHEMRQPELDANLVARNVAEQLERRVAYRRALRLTMQRTMQAGARGIKIIVSGRLGGAEIARTDGAMEGRIPLHTLRADIDFAISEARTTFGQIGVKVWIYKGEVMSSTETIRSRVMDRMTAGPGSAPGRGQGGRGRGRGGRQQSRRDRPAPARQAPETDAAPTDRETTPSDEPAVEAPPEPVAAASAEPEAVAPATPAETEAPAATTETKEETAAPPKKRTRSTSKRATTTRRRRKSATPKSKPDAEPAKDEPPAEEAAKPDESGAAES